MALPRRRPHPPQCCRRHLRRLNDRNRAITSLFRLLPPPPPLARPRPRSRRGQMPTLTLTITTITINMHWRTNCLPRVASLALTAAAAPKNLAHKNLRAAAARAMPCCLPNNRAAPAAVDLAAVETTSCMCPPHPFTVEAATPIIISQIFPRRRPHCRHAIDRSRRFSFPRHCHNLLPPPPPHRQASRTVAPIIRRGGIETLLVQIVMTTTIIAVAVRKNISTTTMPATTAITMTTI